MPTMKQIDDANAANAAAATASREAIDRAKAAMTAKPEPEPESEERQRINEIKAAMRERLEAQERALNPAARKAKGAA